jgi:uncharacterized membrane-anchored protein YhcB (DUF1043 family)
MKCTITTMFFSIAVFGLVLSPQLALAEISVDSYCQLTIQSMQQEITNMQELIALANQYQDDPDTLARQLEIKRAEFDQSKEELYSSFGTTAEEYVMYMGKNSRAVEEFLGENPDTKQQIDNLSVQINSLMEEEEESLEGSSEPPKLPLP